MINKLAIIGDIHGLIEDYLETIKHYEYSLQLGDMGFRLGIDKLRDSIASGVINPANHKFFRGNHDDYQAYTLSLLSQNFGTIVIGGVTIWMLRGGESLDKSLRIEGKDWFPNEQLTIKEMTLAIRNYKAVLPNLVVTHEGPSCVAQRVGSPHMLRSWDLPPDYQSRTGQLLTFLWGIHKPKKWICGHYHNGQAFQLEGTQFIHLGELEIHELSMEV